MHAPISKNPIFEWVVVDFLTVFGDEDGIRGVPILDPHRHAVDGGGGDVEPRGGGLNVHMKTVGFQSFFK